MTPEHTGEANEMIPTPRVDAVIEKYEHLPISVGGALAVEARKLEKELSAMAVENAKLREECFGRAAQICRYYLKHQNYPGWDRQSEYEKGVTVACGNLEKEILEELAALSPNREGGEG